MDGIYEADWRTLFYTLKQQSSSLENQMETTPSSRFQLSKPDEKNESKQNFNHRWKDKGEFFLTENHIREIEMRWNPTKRERIETSGGGGGGGTASLKSKGESNAQVLLPEKKSWAKTDRIRK